MPSPGVLARQHPGVLVSVMFQFHQAKAQPFCSVN
jgi:hypothetical protein